MIILSPSLIQVFAELRISFSVGGRHFPSDSIIDYVYMPDMAMVSARNVSIHLGFKLARYLKLQFTFASEWLLISELYFHSGTYQSSCCDVNIA